MPFTVRSIAMPFDRTPMLVARRETGVRSLGFRRDQAIMTKHGSAYARCDVAMRYRG